MPASQRETPRILLVSDDERRSLVWPWLTSGPYELVTAAHEDIDAALRHAPDLVVLTSDSPVIDPFALCAELVRLPDEYRVPVLMFCDDTEVELALASGADEVITPTLLGPLLGHRVRRLLQEAQLASRVSARDDWHLFEQHAAMTLLIEPEDGLVLEANAAACLFYGYPASMLRGMALSQLDAAPHRQSMAQVIRATATQDTYFVFAHRLASGEMRDVEMYSSPTHWQGRLRVLSIMHDVTQRRAVENHLRDSLDRYRTLIEDTSDVLFTLAPDLTITTLSPSFERVTGYAPEDWYGHSIISLFDPDDVPRAMAAFDRLLRGETPPRLELRFNTADGQQRAGEFLIQPELHDHQVTGILGALRDVTAHRTVEEAERELRALTEALRDTAAALNSTLERDALLEQILEQAGRIVASDSSNIMLIEDGVARVFRSRGYDTFGLEDAIHNLRFSVADTPNMRQMVETGKPFVIADIATYPQWVSSDVTQWIRSHVSAPIRVDGKVIGFLNLDSATPNAFTQVHAERLQSFADQAGTAVRYAEMYDALRRQAEIMEQRVAERTAELEVERAQLWTILDSLNEGVLYDELLQVRYINRALTELTGYTIDEWHGYLDLLRPASMSDDEFARLVDELYSTVERGDDWHGELRIRRKDDTEFDADVTVSQVADADGRTIGAVTVIRDISREKALEAQKSRFVAYASHELRTPITNLKTRLYLMRRQPDSMADHLRMLEDITERMRRLVEDLLDTSRFEHGMIAIHRQNVLLQTLVHRVVQMQEPEATRKQITLLARLPDLPLRVNADPERLVQVLTNLVVNAINYTPSGGTVIVSAAPSYDDPVAPAVVIAVQDTGVGIDPEHLPHIFQPFYRIDADSGGTGLGLSIAQHIVALHGGEISVESEPGNGTIFRVRLPLGDRWREPSALPGTGNALQPH